MKVKKFISIINISIYWYLTISFIYTLALALLGPISDILRIAGAYFVRRNRESRSPLSTAVTAAYTEVMLRKHGAISIMIEKARSRTGRVQGAYHDGLINMVVEGTVQNEEPTVIVPINITCERIPELRSLVAQVLDQKQTKAAESKKNEGKYGRAFIGFGEAFDLGDAVTEASLSKQKRASTIPVKDEDAVADFIAHKVQRGQQNASVLSPTTLVAATLLFGRTYGGISLKDIYKHVSWLRDEIMLKEIHLDWQADEEVSTIVSYAFKLLDTNENLTLDGKRMTPQTVVGVVDHVDNVMCLSYNASQLIEIFLPESLLSMVYLSIKDKTTRDELLRKFTFLVRLFKHEFIYPWKREETFGKLLDWFIKKGLLVHTDGDQEQYERVVSIENNQEEYTRVCLLASLIYPTLDAYWVTSCSLSVLCNLPYMPRKIVPVLSQWIAAHLIAGRRTIYREVLSTEASQNALDNLLAIGFIDAVHPKEKLSPDAQILLLELGVVTNEDLVMVSDRENNDHNDEVKSDIEKKKKKRYTITHYSHIRTWTKIVCPN
jgi:glycerol-3-phosphate O-acyltransferase